MVYIIRRAKYLIITSLAVVITSIYLVVFHQPEMSLRNHVKKRKLDKPFVFVRQTADDFADTGEMDAKKRLIGRPALVEFEKPDQDFASSVLLDHTTSNELLLKSRMQCSAVLLDAKSDISVYETWNKLDKPDYAHFWQMSYANIMPELTTLKDLPKLTMFVVPFSHVDPGWLETYDDYTRQTDAIFDSVTKFLPTAKDMRFIWSETSFLESWWNKQDNKTRQEFKGLVQSGQLEITNGAWTMTDEASPYYWATIDNMIEGHQYVKQTLGVAPRVAWTCDSFGYGTTVPFLYHRANMTRSVINRIHRILKYFYGKQKQMNFRWRQGFDAKGKFDVLTAVTAGNHYDVSNSCGPDHAVCCQFDFKRITLGGCEGERPAPITTENIQHKSEELYKQYRRLSAVSNSNVIFTVLGDDFRFTDVAEIKQQYDNYKLMFTYMNKRKELNIDVKFGTFHEFFQEFVRQSGQKERGGKQHAKLPTLIGDFFPYTGDIGQAWTGYFSSRPFHKKLERIVQSHLRAADILSSIAVSQLNNVKGYAPDKAETIRATMIEMLSLARRNLALFQHHDAITGTSKAAVMQDYGKRLAAALADIDDVIAASTQLLVLSHLRIIVTPAHRLNDNNTSAGSTAAKSQTRLSESGNSKLDESASVDYRSSTKLANLAFETNLKQRSFDDILRRNPITTSSGSTSKIIVYNSLPYQKRELIRLVVSASNVQILDSANEPIEAQLNPYINATNDGENAVQPEMFEVVFIAELPPLALTTFKVVQSTSESMQSGSTTIADIYCNSKGISFPSVFKVHRLPSNGSTISLETKLLQTTHDPETGLLQSVMLTSSKGTSRKATVEFWRYDQTYSGAYIFRPVKPIKKHMFDNATVIILKGLLISESITIEPVVAHKLTVVNTSDPESLSIHIQNLIDVRSLGDSELVMRLNSDLQQTRREFYTDSNGYQMIKRKFRQSKGIENSYYPIAASVVLKAKATKLTLFSGQPHGVTSPEIGSLEVMLDRMLSQDDGKGMGEAVKDNVPVISDFRILLESLLPSENAKDTNNLYHSPLGNHIFMSLLYPPVVLTQRNSSGITADARSQVIHKLLSDDMPINPKAEIRQEEPTSYLALTQSFPCDVQLLNVRSLGNAHELLLLLNKFGQACNTDSHLPTSCLNSDSSSSSMLLKALNASKVTETSLTGMYDGEVISDAPATLFNINQMDITAFKVLN